MGDNVQFLCRIRESDVRINVACSGMSNGVVMESIYDNVCCSPNTKTLSHRGIQQCKSSKHHRERMCNVTHVMLWNWFHILLSGKDIDHLKSKAPI